MLTGLDLSGRLPFNVGKLPARWGVYGVYTHFFGTDLYMQDMGEIGVQLGLIKDREDYWYDKVSLGVGYVFGKNYDGVSVNLGFNF